MRPNIIPAFVLCAVILLETRAQEQSASGYNGEGYSSSGDDSNYESDGSGSNGQNVQKVIDAMKKLNKNKSDEELSKNIKTGARQVMHSIVEKLVTHTGKKVSSKVGKLLDSSSQKKTNTNVPQEKTRTDSQNEAFHDAPEAKQAQDSIQKGTNGKANEKTRKESFNTDLNTDDSVKKPVPGTGIQKSALPVEKNALDQTSQNDTSVYTQPNADSPGEEDTDTDDKSKYDGSRLTSSDKEDGTDKEASQSSASAASSPTNQVAISSQEANSETQASQDSSSLTKDTNSQDTGKATNTEKVTDSAQSLSINVENPGAQETQSFTNNDKELEGSADSGSGGRNKIPQEQTVESISSNVGPIADNTLHNNNRKIKHAKSKKRYKTHTHSRTSHKTPKHKLKTRKNTRVRYTNVDKTLIKRGKDNAVFEQTHKEDLNRGYEAPISNQLESVLNVNTARHKSSVYSKSSGHRKRSNSAENRRSHAEEDDSDDDEDDDSSDSYNEHKTWSKNARNPAQSVKNKKKKQSRKSKNINLKKSSSKHRNSFRSYKQNSQTSPVRSPYARVNRTMPTKAARFEAPVRKFKFFGVPKNEMQLQNENATAENPAIPILNIESAATKPPTPAQETPYKQAEQGDSSEQVAPLGRPGSPAQPGPAEADQPGSIEPSPTSGEPSGPMPLLLIRPTIPQSAADEGPSVVVPTSSGRPIVPIFPTEEAPSAPEEENTTDDNNPDGNSTSFIPPETNTEQPSQPAAENEALVEEVKSLESRMTVVEAAVAEIIEWIRNRGNQQAEAPPQPELTLRPAMPYPRPSLPMEGPPGPPEIEPPHRPRILKQIFIPLPPPNTEAEKEIESGEPVNGLPFPLNFVVAKMLAKMAKARDRENIQVNHPHTPVPDVDIPAIEHDINRLEMELGSSPKPFHHKHHRHFRLHRPVGEHKGKEPLIGQLVNSEPEQDESACSTPCQNGGICLGNNICRCPAPFSGPLCGSMTLVKVANPTSRMLIENPEGRVAEALRRQAYNQYSRFLPQKVRDYREKRRLVQMLKGLLRNIAAENTESMYNRRDNLPVGTMDPEMEDSINDYPPQLQAGYQ